MDEKEKKIKSSARPVTGPWKASSQDAGKPLVLFIYEKIESKLSRREIKKSIASGRCAINGKTERFASTILSPGWVISLKAGALTSAIPRKPFNETEILYDDSSLLIYNKPAGISSDDPNLTTWLQKRCRRIILMHRLDKNTTGALLFAKNKAIDYELFPFQLIIDEKLFHVNGHLNSRIYVDTFLEVKNHERFNTIINKIKTEELYKHAILKRWQYYEKNGAILRNKKQTS